MEMLGSLKDQYHPHLAAANIAVDIVDSKAYVKNEINLGKVSKFSQSAKLWMAEQKYDFRITLVQDVWYEILDNAQRQATLDLHLTRCQVELIPNSVIENGKKKVIKDEHGRIEYTNEVKTLDDGSPAWKVLPLNLHVISQNIKRFGVWCEDIMELKMALEEENA